MNFENGILVSCKIPFRIDLIPKANKTSRSQLKLNPTSITVHNPGNKGTAKQQSDYIDEAYDRYASWHFTIGDNIIYQELPIDEVAWHSTDGKDGKGNRTSIAIEVEETPEAEETAIMFIRLLKEYIKTDLIVPHKHWFPSKYCPRKILPHWDQFIRKIKGEEMTNREIQARLKELGYYNGAIDGSLGPASKEAIKEFQANRGLVVDGLAGPKTQAELQKPVENQNSSVEQRLSILESKVAELEKKS